MHTGLMKECMLSVQRLVSHLEKPLGDSHPPKHGRHLQCTATCWGCWALGRCRLGPVRD